MGDFSWYKITLVATNLSFEKDNIKWQAAAKAFEGSMGGRRVCLLTLSYTDESYI